MATITEIRFAHEDGALADTLRDLPDLDVTVVREASTEPQRNRYFLALDYDGPEEVRAVLERDHTVREVTPMPEFEDRNLWGIEFAPETKLLGPRVTREGGFVVDARSSAPGSGLRGWHERWLLPDREAVHAIWQFARDEGFELEVLDLRKQGSVDTTYPAGDALTDEQRTALLAAYEQGYFAEPRETSLQELADSLDHSPSAVAGRLKRGMKALIGGSVVVDPAEE